VDEAATERQIVEEIDEIKRYEVCSNIEAIVHAR
jgi:hypothetical protein